MAINDNKLSNEELKLRIVLAGDLSTEQVKSIADNFARKQGIDNYSVSFEKDDSLIGGFIIFARGTRYDYSIKGQLDRMGAHIKQTRVHDDSNEFKKNKVYDDIKEAINSFPEEHTISVDSYELQNLDEESFNLRIDAAFNSNQNIDEVGVVLSISDGVAQVGGLTNCLMSELISFGSGAYGIAMNLEKDSVGVVLLSLSDSVSEGMVCKRTNSTISVPVGIGLLGRVIDPLGNPIDGKGIIRYTETRPIESPAPSIVDRSPVNKPLHTGITAIDALTPIGRGQRELIIGDRQTGKTAIAIDTIINQRGKDTICVYVAIGQKMSNVVSTVNLLEKYGALDYTVVVVAGASDSASLQYIAPFAGCAIAEKYMYDNNRDVLIVYDDLSKHAQAYRAISLLLRRPPGREAYPGDVFYLHSRLLERAAKLNESLGGGSITALPIIETQGNDISAYIPTNVISITDGQIFLEPELFFSGQRPAINVGLSVSRVGGAAQTKATKKVSGPLRISLAQAREMASFSQFGSDLDANTKLQITRGVVLNEVLKQDQFKPISMAYQVIIIYLATSDRMNYLDKHDIKEYYLEFLDKLQVTNLPLIEKINMSGVFDDEIKEELDRELDKFNESFLASHEEYSKE